MATYCEEGNTARVIFPDGSVQDFTDTPIDVICEVNKCQRIQVNYFLEYFSFGAVRTGNFFTQLYAPVRAWRINPENNKELQAFATQFNIAGGNCNPIAPFQWLTVRVIGGSGYFISSEITSIVQLEPPDKFTVFVYNSLGVDIASKTDQPNCGVSVECIEGCPPNTLDCEDCCLPCDTVLHSISGMRSQLARLN